MFNPLSNELLAREQHNERLKRAEQHLLLEAPIADKAARRFMPPVWLDNLLMLLRHLFKRQTPVDKQHSS